MKKPTLTDCMDRWYNNKDDYFGVSELAEVLGVSKRQVSSLLAKGRLIEPVARLKMGPVWTRQQVRTHILNTFM